MRPFGAEISRPIREEKAPKFKPISLKSTKCDKITTVS
jgi:hypothetical protein